MIRTIGVIGLGQMGSGIAYACIAAGYKVIAVDVKNDMVQKGVSYVHKMIENGQRKGRISEEKKVEMIGLLRTGVELAEVSKADLIIEAVTEDMELKSRTFRQLESICSENAILASNTSSLSITSLASGLKEVSRMIGLHFFNPVPVMRLVEVIKTMETSNEVAENTMDFIKSIGKTPILVRDQAGFLVNFLLTPYLFDAMRALSNGLASVEEIDNGMKLGCGYPMGPLALADLIGLDMLYKAGNILFEEYRESRFAVPPILKKLVQFGQTGVKSGRGFYDYSDSDKPDARNLI